nr:carboxymuconolactone decarboxylase family protein [Mesorhizobium sangaii]
MKEWQRASFAISSSLEPSLAELVKIRASQINGCANCLNMHTVFAREDGETEQRIYLLSAWREAPGLPGFITLEADGELQTTALDIEDGKIAAIYVVRNPDRLRHLH